jgi:hypothetical protein
MSGAIILYKPVNQKELDLIKQSGWKGFPIRGGEQNIFYPVRDEAYTAQITKEWNVPAYGVSYIVRCKVSNEFVNKYKIAKVGALRLNELLVPSEEMEEFNTNILEPIEVIGSINSL